MIIRPGPNKSNIPKKKRSLITSPQGPKDSFSFSFSLSNWSTFPLSRWTSFKLFDAILRPYSNIREGHIDRSLIWMHKSAITSLYPHLNGRCFLCPSQSASQHPEHEKTHYWGYERENMEHCNDKTPLPIFFSLAINPDKIDSVNR